MPPGGRPDWPPKRVGRFSHVHPKIKLTSAIDWVVVGGESGERARPMHPAWARQIRDDCAAAGVPFLFKQWGEWAPVSAIEDTNQYYHPAPARDPEATRRCKVDYDVLQLDGARGDKFDFRPGAMLIMKIGKRAAGRTLDGVIHDAYPAVRS